MTTTTTTPATEGPADPEPAPAPKRSRLSDDSNDDNTAPAPATTTTTTTTLRSTLLDAAAVAALREAYPQAPGYPHCVVRDVLDPEFFRALREEMVSALSANFKETDLFKLYQTGDLANIDAADPEMARRLPHLLALREAIYSPRFRDFVREITGCEPLTDRTDCSSNLYAQGCHLLCHDDVIGTRCISFIIYLTDPDESWEEADGGALEIYPLLDPDTLGEPGVVPIKNHLPLPNSMAFFTVLPGKSFHAVEEVYREGKMRLSISGWYHAANPPVGKDLASLNQLQTREDENENGKLSSSSSYINVPPPPLSKTEIEAGKALLAKWINPTYLAPGAMQQILGRFQEDGSVLLHSFLLPEIAQQAASLLRARDKEQGVGMGVKPPHEVGYGQGWQPVGPPHKQRYLRFTADSFSSSSSPSSSSSFSCPCGTFLSTLRDDLFTSPTFAHYLAQLTNLPPTAVRTETRRFRPGLDYTLAHYGILTKDPRLDASICFVDDGNKRKEAVWGSGDVGGFGCYIKAEEGNDGAEAAESYRRQQGTKGEGGDEDEGDDVLSVFAASNALSLVLRETSAMRFVKYVSASAPGSRWDVVSEYKLAGDEGKKKKEEETVEGK